MKRYELDPVGKKLVEAEGGPWIFYADAETLQAQLAEAREAIRTLLNTDSQSAWELILGETTLIKINALAGKETEA